jgi:hypothetical protein
MHVNRIYSFGSHVERDWTCFEGPGLADTLTCIILDKPCLQAPAQWAVGLIQREIGSNGGHVSQTARRPFIAPHQSHWMSIS